MFDDIFKDLDAWKGEIEELRSKIAEFWPDANGDAFCEGPIEQATRDFQTARERCDEGARLASDVDERKAEFQRAAEAAQKTSEDLARRRDRLDSQAKTFNR